MALTSLSPSLPNSECEVEQWYQDPAHTQLNFIYRALSTPQVEPKCCTEGIKVKIKTKT